MGVKILKRIDSLAIKAGDFVVTRFVNPSNVGIVGNVTDASGKLMVHWSDGMWSYFDTNVHQRFNGTLEIS